MHRKGRPSLVQGAAPADALVIFGITLFILKKKVFGPVGEIITKRRDTIAENIDEAERSRDEELIGRLGMKAETL